MQCPDCKNEVLPGEPFCDHCGRSLSDLAQSPPVIDAGVQVNPPPTPDLLGDSAGVVAPPVQLGPLPGSPPAPSAAKLIIKDGGAMYDLRLGHETIVGRTDPLDGIYPDIDLTAHDAATGVSRRHAAIHEQGGQWFVKDLNSTNYTVVNRQRMNPDQDFLLGDGDEIRFGRVATVFRCV